MNIYSTFSNSFFNESSPLTSIHDSLYQPSLFSTITEQFYYDYLYHPTSISILNYPEYSSDNYNPYSCQPSSSLIPVQKQTVSTTKIYINPFFRSHSSNSTNESLSEIKQQQQHNSSLSSRSRSWSRSRRRSCSRSRSGSRSRSRSPVIDRQVIQSFNKKRKKRQNRAAQQEKFRKEKELIFKRQSSTKFKHHRLPTDRWEHKEEKLERLFKEYSNEDTFKQWKPLVLKDCFELYEYAFEKHYQTSIDN